MMPTPIRTSLSTSAIMTKLHHQIVRLTRRRPTLRRRLLWPDISVGIFLMLSVWVKVAAKTPSFLIFVGVVCLDRGIVMFFVGLLVLSIIVGVKWVVMDICGVKC